VGTPTGGTFTFGELKADLRQAGFVGARLVLHGEGNVMQRVQRGAVGFR